MPTTTTISLRIEEAIARYQTKHHKRVLKQDVAGLIWPDSSDSAKRINMGNLIAGRTERISPDVVIKICKALEIDPNYLFGWDENK